MAVLPGGGGFSVDTAMLEQAATEATSIGVTLSTLASAIDTDLETALRIGLGVGAALQSVRLQWGALLNQLAGQVSATGASLMANAAAYGETDTRTSAAISAITE